MEKVRPWRGQLSDRIPALSSSGATRNLGPLDKYPSRPPFYLPSFPFRFLPLRYPPLPFQSLPNILVFDIQMS